MKYLVVTAKHHDGFALYDSEVSNYNSVDATPYKTDIIDALHQACKSEGIAESRSDITTIPSPIPCHVSF